MNAVTAERRKYSYPANTKRYQDQRNAEGKCRRCGTQPRMMNKNGALSPYCVRCRARASDAEIKRQARLREAGNAAPSPNSPVWKVHFSAQEGGSLAACGARAELNSAADPAAVNCGNCARTAAYKAVADSRPQKERV